jgi:hypothetical protein
VWICDSTATFPATDDAYTNGNLGKNWNELDEVPHRFKVANKTDVLQTFKVVVGGDNLVNPATTPPTVGYDRITSIGLNSSYSSGGCSVTEVGVNQIGDFGIGGADTQVVQVYSISLPASGECVFDTTFRLAIGSRFISGASNRAFFVSAGAESIPIPSDVEPQELAKRMTATEDSTVLWNIMKGADPTSFNFGNTCDLTDDQLQTDVAVTIDLVKQGVEAAALNAVTTATATNPSRRDIVYDCTDVVFSGDTEIDSQNKEETVEPGDEDFTIDHVLAAGTRSINDELTCTLLVEDLLNPGDFVEAGTLVATYTLPDSDITPGDVINETVEVYDTEEITAGSAYYDFSASQTGGTIDCPFLGGYDGSFTDGPVECRSAAQSDGGTIVFTKTVKVERGVDADGELADTASITLDDGTVISDSATTGFMTDPLIDLKITKTLQDTIGSATTWGFEVRRLDETVVGSCSVDIAASGTTGDCTVNNLLPGDYKVVETPETGWVPVQNPILVTLALEGDDPCSDQVDFVNGINQEVLAQIQVQKLTDPTGEEDGWKFDLTGPESDSLTTTGAGYFSFDLNGGTLAGGADEGTYSITEDGVKTDNPPWYMDPVQSLAVVSCLSGPRDTITGEGACNNFSVSYPDDFACVFQCTFKNIQKGRIIIEKQTDPADSPQTFGYTGEIVTTLVDNGTAEKVVEPGSYQVSETVPAGWDLYDIQCSDANSSGSGNTANFEVEAGEEVKCTFYNRERGDANVIKTVSGGPPNGYTFDFEIRTGADLDNTGTVVASCTTDPVNGLCTFTCVAGDPPCVDVGGVAKIVPGDYQFCEANIMPGWTSNLKGYTDAFPLPVINGTFFVPNSFDPLADNSIYCAPFILGAGETETFPVDNSPPPGGDPRTIGFWKNWTSCDGAGGQDPVLDETLALGINCSGNEESTDRGVWIGNVCVDTCEEAVSILDKRDYDIDLKGKKRASDACYNAASQLLASELNVLAQANQCQDLYDLQDETQEELVDEGFDGSGKCAKRNSLLNTNAGELDDYNNFEDGAVCF